MITIHKFNLKRQFSQILVIPGGITNGNDPMTVAVQDGHICFWKMVNTEASRAQKLEIRTYATGQEITPHDIDRFAFLATVIDGIYVRHLYVRPFDE